MNDNYNFASSVIFTVFGLVGNSLEIFIFTRSKFRDVSMFHYLTVASFTSIINVLSIWPLNYQNFFKINQNRLNCKLFLFVNQIFGIFNSWILVLSSFDRCLSIKAPHFKQRNQLKYQLLAIMAVLIMSILINIPYAEYFDIQQVSNMTMCYTTNSNTFINFTIANSIVWAIIPFLLMIFSTCLIGFHSMPKKCTLNKSRKYVKLIIILDIYFLVCNLPSAIFNIVYSVLTLYNIKCVTTNEVLFTYIYNLCSFLNAFYYSFDFFVVLFCNKPFRSYVAAMCGLNCYKKSTNL